MKFLSVAVFAIAIHAAVAQLTGEHPACEMCGCSWCEEGSFPMFHPQGVIVLEDWLASYSFMMDEDDNSTIADVTEDFPYETLPCAVLNIASEGGALAPDLCDDHLRLNPLMRDTCGCPPLPETPPGVVNPFEQKNTTTTAEEDITPETTEQEAASEGGSSSPRGSEPVSIPGDESTIGVTTGTLFTIVFTLLALLLIAGGIMFCLCANGQQQVESVVAPPQQHQPVKFPIMA